MQPEDSDQRLQDLIRQSNRELISLSRVQIPPPLTTPSASSPHNPSLVSPANSVMSPNETRISPPGRTEMTSAEKSRLQFDQMRRPAAEMPPPVNQETLNHLNQLVLRNYLQQQLSGPLNPYLVNQLVGPPRAVPANSQPQNSQQPLMLNPTLAFLIQQGYMNQSQQLSGDSVQPPAPAPRPRESSRILQFLPPPPLLTTPDERSEKRPRLEETSPSKSGKAADMRSSIQQNILNQITTSKHENTESNVQSSESQMNISSGSQDNSLICKKTESEILEQNPSMHSMLESNTSKVPIPIAPHSLDKAPCPPQKSSDVKAPRKRRHRPRETVSATDIFTSAPDESSRSNNPSPVPTFNNFGQPGNEEGMRSEESSPPQAGGCYNWKKRWLLQHSQEDPGPAVSRLAEESGEGSSPNKKQCGEAGGGGTRARRNTRETVAVSDIFNSTRDTYQKLFESPCVQPDSSCTPPRDDHRVYIQMEMCSVLTPKPSLMCRECRARGSASQPAATAAGKPRPASSGSYCRFVGFRKLRNSKNKYPSVVGFLDAAQDSSDADSTMWATIKEPIALSCKPGRSGDRPEKATYRLREIGGLFCHLIWREMQIQQRYTSLQVYWKKMVVGCRETCDVCATSIFNLHWVCPKCGFLTCLDCYDAYTPPSDLSLGTRETQQDRNGKIWLKCTKAPHNIESLRLTQVIPPKCVDETLKLLHQVCQRWNISHDCPVDKQSKPGAPLPELKAPSPVCDVSSSSSPSLTRRRSLTPEPSSDLPAAEEEKPTESEKQDPRPAAESPGAIQPAPPTQDRRPSCAEDDCSNSTDPGTDWATTSVSPTAQFQAASQPDQTLSRFAANFLRSRSPIESHVSSSSKELPFNAFIEKLVDDSYALDDLRDAQSGTQLSSLEKSKFSQLSSSMPSPDSESSSEFSVSWMRCAAEEDGRLLWLRCGDIREREVALFSSEWRRNKPIIVSGCSGDTGLYFTPEEFENNFGEDAKADLVDCRTQMTHPLRSMGDFWRGFSNVDARPQIKPEEPIIFKLKDWPPGEDFREIMPEAFDSLMKALPLSEYTTRNGALNLVSSLPEHFVKPDLGPKMYNAYGSAGERHISSTNLHMDISDAVNVCLHVSEPQSSVLDVKTLVLEDIKAVNPDPLVFRRIEAGEIPAAIWHIFSSQDVQKVRHFLRNESELIGKPYAREDDPIHDQEKFLHGEMLEKLRIEEGVSPWTIVQFKGDCIFIPAYSPHQVRNLNSCMKAAIDFVSPERVDHCLKVTEEHRMLSDRHSNHEDKLQIKSIVYHAVKDAVSVLKFR